MLNPIIKIARHAFLTLAVGVACSTLAQAQQVKFGLRAGLNIGNIIGEKESDENGMQLETMKAKTRISFAATMKWAWTENFGMFTELGFIQAGGYHRFEGKSYMRFPEANNQLFVGHQRLQAMNIINGYLQLPLGLYVEAFKKKVVFEGGVTFGLLISSKAWGVLKYTDNTYPDNHIEYNLDYNYLKDKAGQANTSATSSGRVGGNTIYNPTNIGAYYFNPEKEGNYFNRLDFALNVGVAYNLSKGLRLGTRFQYGLLDITNNYYDYSLSKLENNSELIKRNDVDRNIGVQIFVGLQF